VATTRTKTANKSSVKKVATSVTAAPKTHATTGASGATRP
jgi:hypothetical protein